MTTTRTSRAQRAPADVQPSVVTDPPLTFSETARRIPISVHLLQQMVERGDIPEPITPGSRTRYYSGAVSEEVIRKVRAKLEGRA
jgi:hypothetical protein